MCWEVGGELASIVDSQENGYLHNRSREIYGEDFWIGLYRNTSLVGGGSKLLDLSSALILDVYMVTSFVLLLLPKILTLPMLKQLPSKAQGCKEFGKSSKPCHLEIHGIALAEFSRMSNHGPA